MRGALLRLVARVLEPLVHLLLELGVGAGEMTRVVRGVYVRVAAQRASRGRSRPNISRIAVVTGLARPEIRALLRGEVESPPQYSWDRHRAERVLYAWWNDPTFLGADGKPADLPMKGEKRSFAALVKEHSGQTTATTILEELERAKAVELLDDGKIRFLSRTLANASYDERALDAVGERVRDLLTTLLHNLQDPAHPRYEATVASVTLEPREVPRIRRDIVAQSEALIAAASDLVLYMGANVPPGAETKAATRLGVTVFVFEEPVVIPASRPEGKKRSSAPTRKRGR